MVRAAVTTVLAALCTIPAFAQQDVPGLSRRPDPIPTLHSQARIVSLDIVVTDKQGHTVPGLTVADFTLTEDASPQSLAALEEHTRPDPEILARALATAKLPPNTFSDAPSPIPESSAIILVLDTLDSPGLQDQMYLRQEMIDYMRSVPPGTRIAIVQLDTSVSMVQGLSSDPETLLQAVQSKRDYPESSALASAHCDPRAPQAMLGAIGLPAGMAGGCDHEEQLIAQQVGDQQRKAILTRVMPQIISYIAAIPGRKSVVWFYGFGLDPGNFTIRDRPGTLTPFKISTRDLLEHDETHFLQQLNRTTAVLKLNEIAFQPVNIAPTLFETNNGLREKLASIADSAWNFYTVSYTPTNSHFDGSLRRLHVSVNRPGLQLQYRSTYFARDSATPLQTASQTASQPGPLLTGPGPQAALDNMIRVGAATPHDVLFTAHIQPSPEIDSTHKGSPPPPHNYLEAKYRNGKYRNFDIRYTVDPTTLLLMGGPDHMKLGQLEVVAVVFDARGAEVNSILSKASIHAIPVTWQELQKTGVQIDQTIAVPVKGNFFLRLAVHDKSGDKVGGIEIPVDNIRLNLQN